MSVRRRLSAGSRNFVQVVWIATPRFAGLAMTGERAVRLDHGVGATQDAGSALDCSGLAVFAMTGFGLTRPKQPAVYIMASQRNGTLYVGVTSDFARRV